ADASTPAARFKRTLNELTGYGGEFPPSFLRGSRHELILLRDPAVDSVIAGVLARARTARFVVVLNLFWQNEVGAALDGISSKPRYRVVADTAFRGLGVTTYRLRR
ncbi:MAG: hypothetical protein ACRELX_00070, partial [Longimicrobiales bacterium]